MGRQGPKARKVMSGRWAPSEMMVLPGLKVRKARPGQPVCQARKDRKVIPVALKVRPARQEPMEAMERKGRPVR